MTRRGALAAVLVLAALLLLAACEAGQSTRILVVATADPGIVQRSDALRVRVHSDTGLYEESRALDALSWPIETTIVPSGGDPARTYRVELAALDAEGGEIVIARAASGFVEGETRVLRMHLEEACSRVLSCGELQTCRAGRCEDAYVDPRTLPSHGLDGDVPVGDAGMPPIDDDAGTDACTPIDSYADEDGDGWGDPSTLTVTCTLEAGRVTRADDCDDACPSCTPAGVEQCDGAHDEDCDGTADEGCACTAGATRGCPSGTDAGACVAGVQTCVEGSWGACVGRVDPLPESCDAIDEDCDGRTDEGLRRECGIDVGACARGFETCTMGAFGGCTAIAPRTETCNALDDDCDGRTDEMVGTTFYRDADGDGFGNASTTIVGCAAPAGWVATPGDCNDTCRTCRPGGTEVCEGTLDENCSMGVDEGCACTSGSMRACPGGVDTGECNAGSQVCTAGAWAACTGRVGPAAETCNGRDDDCDARIDEALVQGCGPMAEIGVCRRGTQTCSAGAWSVCSGAVLPGTETCNGLDDDCDGMDDEGVTTTYYRDGDGDGYGLSGSTRQACMLPSGHAARAGDCDDMRASINPGATESCNMLDDDCDTMVDDGMVCGTDAGMPMPDAGPRDGG